ALEFREESTSEQLFATLSLGLRDYLRKCNFKSAVLGLSGGVDSAVVAVIAVESLRAENVVGVSMPSQYSSRGSIDDAKRLAENLGIKLLHVPIAETFAVFKGQFKEVFSGLPENETEENMQPRLRAMTLMALSNKFGHLLLSTGNKIERARHHWTRVRREDRALGPAPRRPQRIQARTSRARIKSDQPRVRARPPYADRPKIRRLICSCDIRSGC